MGVYVLLSEHSYYFTLLSYCCLTTAKQTKREDASTQGFGAICFTKIYPWLKVLRIFSMKFPWHLLKWGISFSKCIHCELFNGLPLGTTLPEMFLFRRSPSHWAHTVSRDICLVQILYRAQLLRQHHRPLFSWGKAALACFLGHSLVSPGSPSCSLGDLPEASWDPSEMGSGAEFYTQEAPDTHRAALSSVRRPVECRARRSLRIQVPCFFEWRSWDSEKLNDLPKVRKVVIILARAELRCSIA